MSPTVLQPVLIVGDTPGARDSIVTCPDSPKLVRLSWRELLERGPNDEPTAVLVHANRTLDRHGDRLMELRETWMESAFFGFALRSRGEAPGRTERLGLDGLLTEPLPLSAVHVLAASVRERRHLQRWLRQAESRIREQASRLDHLIETSKAANSLLEPRMVIRFVMERMRRLLGCRAWLVYLVDEDAGGLVLEMAGGDAETSQEPRRRLELGRGLAGWVARYRRPVRVDRPEEDPRVQPDLDGLEGVLPETLLAAPLVSRGRIIGVVELMDRSGGPFTGLDMEMVRTMTEPAAIAIENAVLFQKLEVQSVTDDLTKLYNARYMDSSLRREIKRARRYGHEVSLLFLDLDGFKNVNDTHGHMAGSRTLVEVGRILADTVREIDSVARWGGDEFTLVLPQTGPDGALVIAERIRRRIADQVFLEEHGLEVRVSASIGVASFPGHGVDAAQLLQAADRAMYRVKESGRNGVILADYHADACRSGAGSA